MMNLLCENRIIWFMSGYKNIKIVLGQKLMKLPLPIVRPGNQTRRFTHIQDTVEVCYFAWKQNKSRHYSIANKKSLSILQVAKLFSTKIKYLPSRKGERYASALTDMNLSNKVYKKYGNINLKDYINEFIKNN